MMREKERIAFDLRRLVEDVAGLFTASARSKQIELACFVPSGLPSRVQGDPHRLRCVSMSAGSRASAADSASRSRTPGSA
jgi:hypothetical protein